MCRQFLTVTKENMHQIMQKMGSANGCLIVNTRPTPQKLIHQLDSFGGCGYDLTNQRSVDAAKRTLEGLMSIPENAGKVLCEII